MNSNSPVPNAAISMRQALTAMSLVLLLASCSTTGPAEKQELTAPQTVSIAPPQAQPAQAAPPPPPPTLAHDQAVLAAANTLFSKANLASVDKQSGSKYLVVVDPLIDGVSRMETKATRAMESKIAQLAKTSYPQFEIKPFTAATLAEKLQKIFDKMGV